MKICVIDASNPNNPKANEGYFNFENYSQWENGNWRSYKSYACALKSEFFPYGGENFQKCYSYDGFIVLVDKDFNDLEPFIKKLKLLGKTVFVGYHESMHLAENINGPRFFRQIYDLKKLVKLSDGYWNINTPNGDEFFESLMGVPVVGCPTGYPFSEWTPPVDKSTREGILITTRTLDQSRLKRNTLMAIGIAIKVAKARDTFVTYQPDTTNEDEFRYINYWLLTLFDDNIKIVKKGETYLDWLQLIAKHKVCFQMDTSNSHGQVVGDCALVSVPCIGGNCDNTVLTHWRDERTYDAYYNLRLEYDIETSSSDKSLQSYHNLKCDLDLKMLNWRINEIFEKDYK